MQNMIHKTLILCLFFIICQLCGILLYFNMNINTSAYEHLVHECAEMLKYSFVSIAAVSAGGAIFCRVQKEST